MSDEKILIESAGGVGWVTLNNPARRNAISMVMWSGIADAFSAFSADPDIRCAVIKGAGDKAFASGADISEFEQLRANASAGEEYSRVSRASREAMATFEKPLIAMIRGFCMGGGLGIAMTADLRIAADDAIFGIPAARLSVAYSYADLVQLVQLVGPSKAKEILLTARKFDAHEALAMGLINSVVAPAALSDAVKEVTDRLVENAPLSLKASKLSIDEVVKDREARDMQLLADLERACFDSADYKEGRNAFMEKRKPLFSGR